MSWVHDVKQRYVSAQIKSAVKVNTEQLSLDLQNEFPKAKGFSARNLWNMKKWYLFYSGNESFSELTYRMEESLDMKSLKLHQLGADRL